ncbi:MAG: sugar phosphate isomerase/epimerase [Ruminococcaceae bacterium]|nr:sugar phosphate isomerase/epimerase [Oscillospiraceae bacterium]
MALPVAVQLYSIRGDVEKDMKAALIKVKEMGYAGVEFAGLFGNKPADIKAWCEEIGLCPISAHVPIDDMVKDPEGVLSDYAEIGCKFVVVPYVIEERRPGAEKFDQTIEDMKMLGTIAAAKGMTLLYHNHDFEFVKIDGTYGLDLIYEKVPADLLQTEIDTCWVNVGGENPAAYVRKYTGRAPVVHLKDFAGSKSENMYELIGIDKKAEKTNTFEFRPVGFGNQNIPDILAASIDAGAGWVVVEQDQPSMGKTPLECVKIARDYLKLLGW